METKEMLDILQKYKDSKVPFEKYSIANGIALRLEYLQTKCDEALSERKKTIEIFAERTKEKCRDLFSGLDVCKIVDQIQKEMLEELK